MKVLYLIDSLEGYGAEKSIVQIALNFNEVIPVFVHLYKGDKLKSSLLENGIQVYSLNIDVNYGFDKALELLTKIIEKEKPDILHSLLFRADIVARKLKKEYPHLLLVGSLVSNSYGKNRYSQMPLLSRIKLFRTQYKDRFTAQNVNFFICNSHSIKKTNINALNIPSEKIKVIYRGRRFSDFEVESQKFSNLRKALQLENNTIFLNVARLVKSKGQLDLLKAFKEFIKEHPKSILLIAGEGPLRTILEKRINEYGLEKHVQLLGYREDIPELLHISNFFVFPTYYEGLPGALIEAIITKTPSIISNIAENRECFQNGGALFFPAGNIQELVERMDEAVQLETWEEMTNIAYQYAKQQFDIKKVSAEYERFYKSIRL